MKNDHKSREALRHHRCHIMTSRMASSTVGVNRVTHHRLQILIFCVLLVFVAGCGSAGSFISHPSQLVRDPGSLIGRPKRVDKIGRIVSLWEATNGRDPDGKPSRGFAGQILFFGAESLTGVRVKGTVVVYEYDDYDPESMEDPVPIHSFTFEPDAWDVHRTEGTLGHSYSCFIPYMKKNREQVNCGLKVDFINAKGERVSSEIVEVLLPSRSASTAAAARTRGFVRESQLGLKPSAESDSRQETADTHHQDKLESISIQMPRR